jgi:hypothetical protein
MPIRFLASRPFLLPLLAACAAAPALHAGTLSGRVEGFEPNPSLEISVWNTAGERVHDLGSSPVFSSPPLPPGTYFLSVKDHATGMTILYGNEDCGYCDPRFGGPLDIDDETSYQNLVVTFPARADIEVTLTDAATGALLPRSSVRLMDAVTGELYQDSADIALPSRARLKPGRYYVAAYLDGYLAKAHDGTLLQPDVSRADLMHSEPIELAPGASRSFEIALDKMGEIRLRIAGSQGENLTFAYVGAVPVGGKSSLYFTFCENGADCRLAIPPGPHHLLFSTRGYPSRLLGGPVCHFDLDLLVPCDYSRGAVVEVPLGGHLDLPEFRFPAGGTIRGTLTAGDEPVDVELYDAAGRLIDALYVPSPGVWAFERLEPGTYFVGAKGKAPYGRVLYGGLECPLAQCAPTSGQALEIAAGATMSGIDLRLEARPELCDRDQDLCLTDSRFRVRARWRTATGEGAATPRYLFVQRDTGFLWFFEQSNSELAVKILDACYPPYNRFWVFASGMTDVGVELTVEDTVAGVEKRYLHPGGGQPFETILDTDAFATCDAGLTPGPASSNVAPAQAARAEAARVARAAAATPDRGATLPEETTICDDSFFYSLCLGERFRVDGLWYTADEVGTVHKSFADQDSGHLWFFSERNVELSVKVLDGCAINGHYWAFGAGSTNVGVHLLFTDRFTGHRQLYNSPNGTPFAPILDTRAFPCWLGAGALP